MPVRHSAPPLLAGCRHRLPHHGLPIGNRLLRGRPRPACRPVTGRTATWSPAVSRPALAAPAAEACAMSVPLPPATAPACRLAARSAPATHATRTVMPYRQQSTLRPVTGQAAPPSFQLRCAAAWCGRLRSVAAMVMGRPRRRRWPHVPPTPRHRACGLPRYSAPLVAPPPTTRRHASPSRCRGQ